MTSKKPTPARSSKPATHRTTTKDAGEADDGAGPVAGTAMRDVHEALRRLILDGDLAPGSEISQTELSRRLNCSRSPLRESLRLLEREGLIEGSEAYRLVRISSLSMVDVDDLYSLRVLGEALAIWLTVPTLRTADIDALEKDLALLNTGDMAAHRRFHARLRSGAAARQAEHLELLFEHAERYQRSWRENFTTSTDAKLDEHRAILDACIAGDRGLARDRLVDHIADTATRLMMTERHAPYALVEAVAMAKKRSAV